MELKIERDELFRSVSRVQSIVERRSNMPILSTILLNAAGKALTVSATDLELGFQETMPAEVVQEGILTISGRKLFEILKESKKNIFHIKGKENNRVFLSDGVARFELACLPADEFPAFVEPEGVPTVQVKGETLKEMIDKTIYAVTMEEAGFKLSGVFVERVARNTESLLRMVSTDGHRLSLIDKPVAGLASLDLSKGVMVPKKGMNELGKLAAEGGTVQFGFKQKSCLAKTETAMLVIRLLEAKFPDYTAVIPQEAAYTISVDRIVLLDAMRKMGILSSERYRAVKLTLSEQVMELVSTNPELGEAQENITVDFTGERLEMGFNPRYFVDALQAMESTTVKLGFIDDSKPCVLTGDEDQGFLGLIMPMRL